jgi:hypothetical protein
VKIDNVRICRITDSSVEIAWDGSSRSYEIDYRLKGKTKWQTVLNVKAWENPYNVIMLEPETDYEFRVRALPSPVESPVITARTTKSGYKTFSGLCLYPTRRIPTDARTYPCIESHDGFLWVTASNLCLLKIDPVTKKILWSREEPLAVRPEGYGYLGVPDTAIFGGKLYVTYNVQDADATPRSLQYVISYDFLTDTVSTPIPIPPTDPEHVVLFAGIKEWRGKLWIMQRDEWGDRRSLIALRTYKDGEFGKPIVYENVPTPSCWGTSIGTFNDKIVLMFSDLVAALEQAKDQETLYYTLFDGKTFSEARVVHDVGRNRYAKGVQLGDRFVCVYKCSEPYYEEFEYQYHDLALSVFVPGTDAKVQTTMYVDDRKYNSSPDMTVHDGRALTVYNKIEHLYGDSENPAVHYGIFIGEVVPEGDAGKK